MPKKPTHGGKRAGAGRKRTAAVLTVRLPLQLLEQVRTHCTRKRLVMSEWIRRLMEIDMNS